VKYQLTVERRLPIEELSAQLSATPGVKSVAWKKVKKGTA
jgi:hypothetical protein